MIKEAIHKVVNGENLSYDMAKAAMEEIMTGEATSAQISAFITGLRMKGETIDEITACAKVMREKAVPLPMDGNVMDIVGTGGDEVGTFNISTTAMFIVAAGGVQVAKHGNRSVSSKSGAADVLEELGVNLNLTPEQSVDLMKETDICFLFAQSYHSSMKYAAPVRKETGIRSIFNILGPLSNPAGAKMQLLGVYDESLVAPLAQVLSNLGVDRGFVVCGNDGLDELTMTGNTSVCEIRFGTLTQYEISPTDYGFQLCKLEDLIGGTPKENAKITRDILSGKERGPKRDVTVLNAGLALYLGKDNCSIADCVKEAAELIDSGKAAAKLDELITKGREMAG